MNAMAENRTRKASSPDSDVVGATCCSAHSQKVSFGKDDTNVFHDLGVVHLIQITPA